MRLHWGAVVEKPAAAAARIDGVVGRKRLDLDPIRRDEPSREARSALGAAAIDIVVTKTKRIERQLSVESREMDLNPSIPLTSIA